MATVEPDVASRRLQSGGKSLEIGIQKHDAHRVVPGEALSGIHGEAFRRVCSSEIGGNPGGECLISSYAQSNAVQRKGRNSSVERRQNWRRKPVAAT